MSEHRTYLLLFNNEQVDRERFKSFLNRHHAVADWFLFHPGAFAVKLSMRQSELYAGILVEFPTLDFMIVRLDRGSFSGQGPKELWGFIKDEELSDA